MLKHSQASTHQGIFARSCILVLLLVLALFFALPQRAVAVSGGVSGADESNRLQAAPNALSTQAYSVGSTVYFGSYYQDEITNQAEIDIIRDEARWNDKEEAKISGVTIKGRDWVYYKKTPIRWGVVNSSGGVLTLVSWNVLDYRSFGGDGLWGNSELRTWLNDEFFKTAFTKTERNQILTTTNRYYNQTYDDWRLGRTSGYATSSEKVYLLDENDVKSDLLARAGMSNIGYATSYVSGDKDAQMWWLRGDSFYDVGNRKNVYVNREGILEDWFSTWDRGIRPVIRVRADAKGLTHVMPTVPKIKSGYLNKKIKASFYANSDSGKVASYTSKYSDKFFLESTYTEQSDLAIFSSLGAASTYTKKKGKSKNYAKALLKKCGYTCEKGYESTGTSTLKKNDNCRAQFGYKPIPSKDNPKAVVLAVFINGYTDGGYEWISNFNLGDTGEHAGFTKAEKKLRKKLNSKVKTIKKKYGSDVDIKFWITGHSRGAAITNLLAHDLANEYNCDNIFAFGFATPAYSRTASYYSFIRNYIIPGDFVPKVAPQQWGFHRLNCAEEVRLPAESKSTKQGKKMRTLFKKFMGRSYKGFTNKQSNTLVSNFLKFAGSYENYSKGQAYQWKSILYGSPRDFCQKGMARALTTGGALKGVKTMLTYGKANKYANKVSNTLISEGVKSKVGINPRFNDAHCMPSYVAAVVAHYKA